MKDHTEIMCVLLKQGCTEINFLLGLICSVYFGDFFVCQTTLSKLKFLIN